MKHLLVLAIALSVLASCKKADTSNAHRFDMIGNYHFKVIDYNYEAVPSYSDTVFYDGSITLLDKDDGRSVNMTYPLNHNTTLVTTGLSLEGGNGGCPHGGKSISGEYNEGRIFIQDYDFACRTNQFGIYSIVTATKY